MSTTTNSPAARLSPAQQELVSAAAERLDGAVVMPERLKGKAAAKVVEALLGKGLIQETPTEADLPVWRRSGEQGFSLVLTPAGRDFMNADARTTLDRAPQLGEAKHSSDGAQPVLPAGGSPAVAPRSSSKLAIVIGLLRRPEGVSMSKLVEVTDWLPHTTRAALTGLRKRGFTVTLDAAEGGSVYRIADPTPVGQAAEAA